MAYGLKYYADAVRGGRTYRLNIYQRDYTDAARIIGTLQGLGFGYVGNQDIDAAIIKSELVFTLADCWKEPARYDSVRKAYYKFGNWEEFYTSDALLYKVELKEGDSVRWTGFLTPDSYEEDLIYGGSVSFIARDMIGHMGDFDFDMESSSGMLRIEDILDTALLRCGAAMAYYFQGVDDLKGLVTETGTAYSFRDWMLCQETFQGKTFYEAMEAIMDSFGMTMRWIDGNVIGVMPLRSLPDKRTSKDVRFVTSGHRALAPACRKIRETFTYDIDGVIWEWVTKPEYFQAVTLNVGGITSQTYEPTAASPWMRNGNIGMWDTSLLDSGHCWVDLTGEKDLLMVSVVALEANAKDSTIGGNYLVRSMPMSAGGLRCALSFQLGGNILTKQNLAEPYFFPTAAKMTLHWALRATAGDTLYWWNESKGKWESGRVINKTSAGESSSTEFSREMITPSGCADLEFLAYGFGYDGDAVVQGLAKSYPTYGLVNDLRLSQANAGGEGKFVTNTIYSEKNNVIITREPKLGQVPLCANAHVISNGCYAPDGTNGYPALQFFRFADESGFSRLSVLVHKQLLLFHDRPGNSLTGELIDRTASNNPSFGDIWTWNDREHILIGGKYNVRSGHVDSAVLREMHRWNELWGEFKVAPGSFTLTASAATKTLTITAAANQRWQITGVPYWIHPQYLEGVGSKTFTFDVDANPSYDNARSAILSVEGQRVNVTQSKKSKTTPTWDATSKTIDNTEQDVGPISVKTNGYECTLGTDVDWLHLKLFQGGNPLIYMLSADANDTTSVRRGKVTLTYGTTSKYVTITQEAGEEAPMYNVTVIKGTPARMKVTINGVETLTAQVTGGDLVTIVGSADGYATKTYTQIPNGDITITMNLNPAGGNYAVAFSGEGCEALSLPAPQPYGTTCSISVIAQDGYRLNGSELINIRVGSFVLEPGNYITNYATMDGHDVLNIGIAGNYATDNIEISVVAIQDGAPSGDYYAYFEPKNITLAKGVWSAMSVAINKQGIASQQFVNSDSWLQFADNDTSLFVSTREANDTGSPRTATIVGTFVTTEGETITATLTVTQSA